MPTLEKGQNVPLNVTKQAQHRVLVGLGWDPNENTSLLDKAKALASGVRLEHDLDLACYIYDPNGNYISRVCAVSGCHTDQTGKIYHSGDNVEGIGDGDDEQISIELKDLDHAVHSLIFVATIKSGHSFNEVADAEIRIADGYSNHNFLLHELGRSDDGQGKSAFVFVKLTRDAGASDNWIMHYVGEYLPVISNEDARAQDLKQYLAA